MLSPFSRMRKAKERKQAEILVNKGISMLEGHFYHKAMFEFQKALEIDEETVGEFLSKQFEKAFNESNYDLALSVGLIVLKIRDTDYELANKLGNCARRLKKYKQANSLYRQAFRINRNYETALFNLAASMGRIPKYNSDVKSLVGHFANINDFVLPKFKNDTDYLENIIKEIKEAKQSNDFFLDNDSDFDDEDDMLPESRNAILKRKQNQKNSTEPKYHEICEFITEQIKEASLDISTDEKKTAFEGLIFNLGRYALSKKDTALALKCFFQLKSRKSALDHLDMLITLAMELENPSKKVMQHMMILLGKDKTNRYLNVNLGLMFRKRGKKILSYKYLASGAMLLNKTDGIYCRQELIQMADHELEMGNLQKAHHLYTLVDSEIDNIHVKNSLGQIMIYQNRYAEAIPIYKQILEMDSIYKDADQKLLEIHNYFAGKGDELFLVRKFTSSVKYFERALVAKRLPETVKKAAETYKVLMDMDKADALFIEYNQIQREYKAVRKEEQRKQYINQAKEFLKNKDYEKAIELFEKALPMKMDKDVFVYLAHIFKNLDRTEELQDLLKQWRSMVNVTGISFSDI